jgi:PDZ domain
MELIIYTLTQVSYAIVEPSYALILVLMAVLFYTKNKKTTTLEKLIMGENLTSAFELTISQVVMGIFGGVLASLIFTHLGIVFYINSHIYIIFMISVLLMFFNPRFVCLSYSGAILGFVSVILHIVSIALNNPMIDALKVDITSLLILIGVMHIVEGILVILDGKRGAIPVFGGRDKKIVGGFAFKRQWILPIAVLMMMQATSGNFPSGEAVNTPDWWPIINHNVNKLLFETMILGSMPLFAGVGYSAVTFTRTKRGKTLFSGSLIIAFGAFVSLLSLLGNFNSIIQILILVATPVAHEAMVTFEKYMEKSNEPIYSSNEEGIRILEVAPKSIASNMGLQSGDLILEINDIKVTTDEMMFNFLETLPNYLWMKIKRVNGDIKELSHKGKEAAQRIGIVIVPRNIPNKGRIMKTEEGNFGDILNKLRKKDKEDDEDN